MFTMQFNLSQRRRFECTGLILKYRVHSYTAAVIAIKQLISVLIVVHLYTQLFGARSWLYQQTPISLWQTQTSCSQSPPTPVEKDMGCRVGSLSEFASHLAYGQENLRVATVTGNHHLSLFPFSLSFSPFSLSFSFSLSLTLSLSHPCTALDCGIPEGIHHGTVSYPNTLQGSEATYECDEGYELSLGDMIRTCLSNREWSGTPPCCIHKFNGSFKKTNCAVMPWQ